jgi:hypothetical protein
MPAKSIDVCILSLNPPFLCSLLKRSTRVDDKFIFLYIHMENSLKNTTFVCTYILIGSLIPTLYISLIDILLIYYNCRSI